MTMAGAGLNDSPLPLYGCARSSSNQLLLFYNYITRIF
jgi:hypothetical protein